MTNHSGQTFVVKVEVADTPEKRERGLMFRTSMGEDEGMLFVFSEETQASFWMKDTPLSLDMIFIKNGRIVDIIENATPYSLEILTPKASYTSTLEVLGGYSLRHQLGEGDGVISE